MKRGERSGRNTQGARSGRQKAKSQKATVTIPSGVYGESMRARQGGKWVLYLGNSRFTREPVLKERGEAAEGEGFGAKMDSIGSVSESSVALIRWVQPCELRECSKK